MQDDNSFDSRCKVLQARIDKMLHGSLPWTGTLEDPIDQTVEPGPAREEPAAPAEADIQQVLDAFSILTEPEPAEVPEALPPAVLPTEEVPIGPGPVEIHLPADAVAPELTQGDKNPCPLMEDSKPKILGIPFIICHPESMQNAAVQLTNGLEPLVPKFTKTPFRLHNIGHLAYAPNFTFKNHLLNQLKTFRPKVVLMIVEKHLVGRNRRTLSRVFASRGIYFQEVISEAIKEKPFYVDLVLGLTFFLSTAKTAWEKRQTPLEDAVPLEPVI